MKRFERFNEIIFESYCMKSVLNAIKKERNRKDARGEVEQSLSTLTDAILYALSARETTGFMYDCQEQCNTLKCESQAAPPVASKISAGPIPPFSQKESS